MATTKKTTAGTKRKPLEQRKMTTSRYIDDSEGVTVLNPSKSPAKKPPSTKKK